MQPQKPSTDTAAAGQRLNSWKEISTYLGRSVRTVQRWEESEGLPVYRLQHAERSSVYALTEELDRWISDRSSREEREEASVQDGTGLDFEAAPNPAANGAVVPSRSAGPPWAWIAAGTVVLVVGIFLLRPTPASSRQEVIATPVSWHPGFEAEPNISPDGKTLMFSSGLEPGENNFIFLQEFDNPSSRRRLTRGSIPEHAPSWSPDGRKVAFLRRVGGHQRELVVARLEDNQEFVLGRFFRNTYDTQTSWSPDGKYIYFSGNLERDVDKPRGRVYRWALDAPAPEPVTDLPAEAWDDDSPAVSPDGRHLLFTRRSDYEIQNLMVQALVAGAAPKEIRPNGPIHSPKWSVDGKSIFYLHGYEPGVIHRVRLDGTPADPLPGHRPSGWLTVAKAANGGMRIVYPEGNLAFRVNRLRLPSPTSDEPPQSSPTVLVESTRQDVEPRVSPDGQQIVFVSNRSGPFELWLTNRNGAPAQQLTFLNATGMGKPSWSPEGKSIAFCARVGDAPRIYVLTLIDRSVRAVAEGGEGPSWTPDGSYLYFAKHLGARLTIWRIAREQKNAEPLTDQGGMGPTVSPDSKWIYYVHDLKLWRRALNGGDAEVVAPGFGSGSYEIRNDWVYYLEYDPKQTGRKRLPVRALNLITRQAKTLGWVDEPIGDGFAVDPKGQFLYYSFRTRKETDLMQSTVPQ